MSKSYGVPLTAVAKSAASSCCGGTGLADYAAVPCPDPACPVPAPATAPRSEPIYRTCLPPRDRSGELTVSSLAGIGHWLNGSLTMVEVHPRVCTICERAVALAEQLGIRVPPLYSDQDAEARYLTVCDAQGEMQFTRRMDGDVDDRGVMWAAAVDGLATARHGIYTVTPPSLARNQAPMAIDTRTADEVRGAIHAGRADLEGEGVGQVDPT